MTIEDNNQDHHDIDEEAAFQAAVSDVSDELSGEHTSQPVDYSEQTSESVADPLGQMEQATATNSNGKEVSELEQLRADNARLEHSLSSEKGRSKAAQQRWADTQSRLQQVKTELADNPQAFLSSEFRENFPELAEELEGGMAKSAERANQTMLSALDPMESLVSGELEEFERQEVAEAEMAVESAFPNARQILQDPRFDEWLNSQPSGVKGLYHSSDPNDAIYLLNQFSSVPSPGQQVADRRAHQRRALGSPGGRQSVPRDGNGLDDEDALWASISNEVQKSHGYR